MQAILQPKQDAQSNACNRAERKAQPDRETDREYEAIGCRPGHDAKWPASSSEQVVSQVEAAEEIKTETGQADRGKKPLAHAVAKELANWLVAWQHQGRAPIC